MKIGFTVLLIFFVLGNAAFACQCVDFPPLYKEFDDSGAVFIGKVVSTNAGNDRIELQGKDVFFEIEVLESFKGVTTKRVSLNRGPISSSCYSGYSLGETYLFYTDKIANGPTHDNIRKSDVVYQASFCNRTRPLRFAADQLLFIADKRKGVPESKIYGSVALSSSKPGSLGRQYLHGVAVLLAGKVSLETMTDKNGLFRFNNVPAGVYDLKIAASSNLEVVSYPKEWTLTVLPNGNVVRGDTNYLAEYAHPAFYWDAILSEKTPK